METLYDVIIIGSGPAGMSAAVYTSRGGAKTCILESSAPGGKMVKTHLIENYPGVGTLTGVDLSQKMSEHSLAFGATYEYGHVIDIIKNDDGIFEVKTEHGQSFFGKVVIAATGTVERKLGLPKEDELLGRGISYCAVCDGAFFRGKPVIVIGGGNSALDEALYLTQFVEKVTIVIRRDVFRAEQTTVQTVLNHPKIEVIVHHIPVEIIEEEGHFAGLKIQHVHTGEQQIIKADGLFPYIGSDPMTSYLKNLNIVDEAGYVKVNPHNLETEISGLYAAGDMIAKELRQVVTATSDGAIAGQDAFKHLKG